MMIATWCIDILHTYNMVLLLLPLVRALYIYIYVGVYCLYFIRLCRTDGSADAPPHEEPSIHTRAPAGWHLSIDFPFHHEAFHYNFFFF